MFFSCVCVLRICSAADILRFFSEGCVGQAADFETVNVRDAGGTAQVIRMDPGELTVALLSYPLAVDIIVFDGGGDDRAALRITYYA